MTDVLATDRELRCEADELLRRTSLLACLTRYGETHLSGSYVLELMTWRDLDLYIVADDLSEATFFTFGGELATCLEPVRMQFRNERRARTPGLPPGLYWKLDVWVVPRAHHHTSEALLQRIQEQLTPETRLVILTLKTHYCHDARYRRSITS